MNIYGAEAANDRLIVNALGGDDLVEASGLAATAIQLTADGGDGADAGTQQFQGALHLGQAVRRPARA